MSAYFPSCIEMKTHEGVSSAYYDLKDEFGTKVLISRLQPGASVPVHSHAEAQIGIVLDGSLSLTADGQTFRLVALEQAYYLPPHMDHSAVNDTDSEIVTIDIKRNNLPEHEAPSCPQLLTLTPAHTIKTGIVMRFLVGPWFEVMVSTLPKGAVMPLHHHKNEQIGIGVFGHYTVQVGEEKANFGSGSVYYAPGGIGHGGWNEDCDSALSLNVFIPPRYNKERVMVGDRNASTIL